MAGEYCMIDIDIKNLKVAAVSLNQTPLAFKHNAQNILTAIKDARKSGIKLICFPELCLTGYGCEDAFLAKETAKIAMKALLEIVPETKSLAMAIGLPLWYQGYLYNTVCFVSDGKIVGFVAKQNLATYGVHYESRWFKPWVAGKVVDYVLEENNAALGHASIKYPLGDLVFDWQEIKIGFEICEDAWVTARAAISLAKRSVDLILNPSASHFAFGKSEIRKKIILQASSHFGVGYIYANLLGNEAGRIIYDGDTIIAANTEILASGPRFTFQDYVITEAMIDIESLRSHRAQLPRPVSEKDKTTKALKTLFKKGPSFENSPFIKEEEFTRAVGLALFDYLRKSKAKGFVLSLSGGMDSSACVCLIYYMVRLGLESVGAEAFLAKLNFIPEMQAIKEEIQLKAEKDEIANKIMRNILFCLFQGTKNNSNEARESAEALCNTVSCSFASIEIDGLVEDYTHLISGILKQDLTFEKHGIALENIQARVRAPSIWFLANLRSALVICASNRSEASVGYTTMDGDTAGGLSPIAGIDKYFLMKWLNWVEAKGPLAVGNISVLKKVLALSPSAELKPLGSNQKDEEELMPYEWLDYIERLFVRDKLSEVEILTQIVQKFPNENPKKLEAAVKRFLELWSRNQWKRERLAASFHLDDESVDPKTWCRFPILSGDY